MSTDPNTETLSTRDLAGSGDRGTDAPVEAQPWTDNRGGETAIETEDRGAERAIETEDRGAERAIETEDRGGGTAIDSDPIADSPAGSDGLADTATNGSERVADSPKTGSDPVTESLLPSDAGNEFQLRWTEIQARFVDEPRGAVQEADRLVAQLMKQLAETFAQEREGLESQWDRGEDISTEDLRVAFQRYRSFFQRLLAT